LLKGDVGRVLEPSTKRGRSWAVSKKGNIKGNRGHANGFDPSTGTIETGGAMSLVKGPDITKREEELNKSHDIVRATRVQEKGGDSPLNIIEKTTRSGNI